jgi:hypothetical protein
VAPGIAQSAREITHRLVLGTRRAGRLLHHDDVLALFAPNAQHLPSDFLVADEVFGATAVAVELHRLPVLVWNSVTAHLAQRRAL